MYYKVRVGVNLDAISSGGGHPLHGFSVAGISQPLAVQRFGEENCRRLAVFVDG